MPPMVKVGLLGIVLLGTVMVGVRGQEVPVAPELTLRLVPVVPAGVDREGARQWRVVSEVFRPHLHVFKGHDGRVDVGYRLEIWGQPVGGEGLPVLADWLEDRLEDNPQHLTIGRSALAGWPGLRRRGDDLRCEAAVARLLVEEIRGGDGRAEAMRLMLAALEGDEVPVDFRGHEVESWSLTLGLGLFDWHPLGRQYLAVCASGRRGVGCGVRPWTTVVPEDPRRALELDLLEALARVPAELDQGRVVRWRSPTGSLLAFPENKAIFVRSPVGLLGKDGEPVKELRLDLPVARKIETAVQWRDRVAERLAAVLRPRLDALVEEGDPSIFSLWN